MNEAGQDLLYILVEVTRANMKVKIIITIILVMLYTYMFGWNSLQRYMEKSITINRNIIKKDIKSPGFKFG